MGGDERGLEEGGRSAGGGRFASFGRVGRDGRDEGISGWRSGTIWYKGGERVRSQIIQDGAGEGDEKHGGALAEVEGGDGGQGGVRAGHAEVGDAGMDGGVGGAGVHGEPVTQELRFEGHTI